MIVVTVDVAFAVSVFRAVTSPFARFVGNGTAARFKGRFDSFQMARTPVITRVVGVTFVAFVVVLFFVLDGNRHSPLMIVGICSGSKESNRFDLVLRDSVQMSAVRRFFLLLPTSTASMGGRVIESC